MSKSPMNDKDINGKENSDRGSLVCLKIKRLKLKTVDKFLFDEK
jgi:hypothetical protein